MSEPKKNSLADFSSIATLPTLGMLAAGLAYWIHLENANTISAVEQRSDAAEAAIVQKMSDNYETKLDHAADILAIKDWNQRLSEGEQKLVDAQNVISINIEHIKDMTEQNQKSSH